MANGQRARNWQPPTSAASPASSRRGFDLEVVVGSLWLGGPSSSGWMHVRQAQDEARWYWTRWCWSGTRTGHVASDSASYPVGGGPHTGDPKEEVRCAENAESPRVGCQCLGIDFHKAAWPYY